MTAACLLFLVKLRWPKKKSIYDICSIYEVTTHLDTILNFTKKMEQIYENRTGLSLLNPAFEITDQKVYGRYQPPSLDQTETGSDF